MSLGLSLLNAVIEDGSRSLIRDLSPTLFISDELPAYEFFVDFYRRYGGMPTAMNMREGGFPLTPPGGPPGYLIDRCLRRSIFNIVRENLPQFQQSLNTNDIDTLRRAVSTMHAAASRMVVGSDLSTLSTLAEQVLEVYQEARHHRQDGITGITMGWPTLDQLTSGAQPGEVITWVARPNVGKSFTVAHVAKEAWRAGHSVLFVTMEMTDIGMARRVLGVMSGINPDLIKRGTLSIFGEEHLLETVRAVELGAPFYMVAGNLNKTVDQIDAIVQEVNPDLIVIDAQYLLDPSHKTRGSEKQWERLAVVGKEVTEMALTRRRPVHQSVQFNRSQKKGSTDALANIGGTDVVSQISAVVVSISEGETPYEATRRDYEVEKNRDGPKGKFTTNFRFDPLDFSEIPPSAEDVVDTSWML
jgi:replicative DNA helicase